MLVWVGSEYGLVISGTSGKVYSVSADPWWPSSLSQQAVHDLKLPPFDSGRDDGFFWAYSPHATRHFRFRYCWVYHVETNLMGDHTVLECLVTVQIVAPPSPPPAPWSTLELIDLKTGEKHEITTDPWSPTILSRAVFDSLGLVDGVDGEPPDPNQFFWVYPPRISRFRFRTYIVGDSDYVIVIAQPLSAVDAELSPIDAACPGFHPGDMVRYRLPSNDWTDAAVVKVHSDAETLCAYYTINVLLTKEERQTVPDRLAPAYV